MKKTKLGIPVKVSDRLKVVRNFYIREFIDIRKDEEGLMFRIVTKGPGPRGFEMMLTPIIPESGKYFREKDIDEAARERLHKQWEDEKFSRAVKEGMTDEH